MDELELLTLADLDLFFEEVAIGVEDGVGLGDDVLLLVVSRQVEDVERGEGREP